MAEGLRWREYTVQVPEGVAKILDKALDEQVALENRAIDFSEFACWLLVMGLAARAQLVKEHKKSERRIIEP